MSSKRVLDDDQSSNDQTESNELCCCGGAPKSMMELKWVPHLIAMLKPVIEEVVEGTVKRIMSPYIPSMQVSALTSTSRSLSPEAQSSASSSLQLRFVGTLPDSFLTLNIIEDNKGASIKVELWDNSGSKVEVGPESRAKIKISVLNGEFEVEEHQACIIDKFNENIVEQRKGRRPLLVGECEIDMTEGVAILSNVTFTDNSKWTRSGNFRLGAQVVTGLPPGVVVRPAVSRAFKVKERRLQSYIKHKTPSLEDEIWRLDNIAKNGPICQRLAQATVYTVKDLLQLYHSNAPALREILHVPEKKWYEIIRNAKACSLSNECYIHYDDTNGNEILLDCVFNILTVTFDGQTSLPIATLNEFQAGLANKLRCGAFDNRSNLQKIYAPSNHVNPQTGPLLPSVGLNTNVQYLDAAPGNQGEQFVSASQNDGYQMEEASNNIPDYFSDQQFELFAELIHSDGFQTPENRINQFEASLTKEYVPNKLRAVCYVTKAAICFMAIQQDPTVPTRKKQKVG